jgi:hypothetical protein
MSEILRRLMAVALAVGLAAALVACRTTRQEKTYNYDAAAHQRAIELKSRALATMANSGDAYSRHRSDVETASADMEKAYELSAAAPDNAVVAAEWAAIKDPGGDLYGAYVKRWQARGKVDTDTRNAAMKRVELNFDYLLCLEAAKRTRGGICAPPGGAPAAPPPAPEPAPTANSLLSPKT